MLTLDFDCLDVGFRLVGWMLDFNCVDVYIWLFELWNKVGWMLDFVSVDVGF